MSHFGRQFIGHTESFKVKQRIIRKIHDLSVDGIPPDYTASEVAWVIKKGLTRLGPDGISKLLLKHLDFST